MPNKIIALPDDVTNPVTVIVEMPRFDDVEKIIINYQLWLIFGNIKQDLGHGTNTDDVSDKHRLPVLSPDLNNKLLRIDYTLVSGKNIEVSFSCSIGNTTITETLQQIISISSFLFK